MPFKDLDSFRAALHEPSPESAKATRPLVLVVDDDANVRASLELVLSSRYRVRTCANAAEGVAAVEDEVATVILDVKMTGADGFVAYKAMREKDIDLPIIFYSAYQDIKDPYEIINEYRPFGYITKGADYGALLRSVGAAVEQRARAIRHRGLISELGNIQAQMEALRKRMADH